MSILEVKSYSVIDVVTEIDPERDFAFSVDGAEVIHTCIWLNKCSYTLYLG